MIGEQGIDHIARQIGVVGIARHQFLTGHTYYQSLAISCESNATITEGDTTHKVRGQRERGLEAKIPLRVNHGESERFSAYASANIYCAADRIAEDIHI